MSIVNSTFDLSSSFHNRLERIYSQDIINNIAFSLLNLDKVDCVFKNARYIIDNIDYLPYNDDNDVCKSINVDGKYCIQLKCTKYVRDKNTEINFFHEMNIIIFEDMVTIEKLVFHIHDGRIDSISDKWEDFNISGTTINLLNTCAEEFFDLY